jgi:type II secretory pathway component PulF
VLASARIPFGEALRTIAQQEPQGRFRETIESIAFKIESGERIATSMGEHADVFGDVYIETVRAAEHTGNLIKILDYLSELLERGIETRQQLRASLAYPVCVVAVLVLAVVFLVGFVVPRFAKIFESRGLNLPVFTETLVTLGQSMQAWWFLYLAGAVGLVLGARGALRHAPTRAMLERVLHRVPVVRDILTGLAVARFSRVFGLAISSGVGLLDALDMAGRSSGSGMLAADAARMMEQVRSGGRLSQVMGSCGFLPGFAKRMLSAGEESAELPRMCSVVARHYERETTVLTRNICTIIEPLLIIAVAAVVLVIALAIFMPMWDMVKLVG